MSQGVYWLLACHDLKDGREGIFQLLKSRVTKGGLVKDVGVIDIPSNLKYGSFDELIRLIDDLSKHDAFAESVLRRMERQVLEIDATSHFRISVGPKRASVTVEQYVRNFAWDDIKYPRTRLMRANMDMIVTSLQKLEDDIRGKMAAFNDLKQTHTQASKKETQSLSTKDLTDVLTPDLVTSSDFVETEHLTTLVAYVPKGHDAAWTKSYESLANLIVPRSTKKFNIPDKEGSLWRVIAFKSAANEVIEKGRKEKFIIRKFEFSEDVYNAKMAERTNLEADRTKSEALLSRLTHAMFSEVFVGWMHLKAMRVFVESVLRFGVPPQFASFYLKPEPAKEKKLRHELKDIFGATDGMDEEGADVEEAFYSYISIGLVPFLQATEN